MTTKLGIWTVYDHPRKYPDCFVARNQLILRPYARKCCAGAFLFPAPTGR